MPEYMIHKSFFKKNPLEKFSAAAFADFHLTMLDQDELNAEMENIVFKYKPDDERRAQLEQDRNIIEAMDSGEAIVKYMRQEHEGLADPMFCKKALAMQDGAAPLILRRYMTTGQDRFIELAFLILAKANIRYVEQLYADYANIRNPYAQSMACLLFGEREMQNAASLLMEEYERFKREYPDESYNQGPLLALHILYGEATAK